MAEPEAGVVAFCFLFSGLRSLLTQDIPRKPSIRSPSDEVPWIGASIPCFGFQAKRQKTDAPEEEAHGSERNVEGLEGSPEWPKPQGFRGLSQAFRLAINPI